MSNPAEVFFGALYIQTFIASILYGITTLQAFIYFQTYRRDPVPLKCYVVVVWILETVHTAFCIQFTYSYLVANFGNFEYFSQVNWYVMLLAGALIAVMVQSFYVRRVWILSNYNYYLAGFITFFMLSLFAFAVLLTAFSWMYSAWIDLKMHISGALTALTLTSAVIVDVSIVLTLMYFLIRKRHGIPESTKTAVDWILLYVVNTGALTAASRIVSIVLYTTQNDNLAFLGVQEIQGKLYANSILGSLNTRSFLRRKAEEDPGLELGPQTATGGSLQIVCETEVATATCHDGTEIARSTSTRTTKADEDEIV